jgi:hypothetical protein
VVWRECVAKVGDEWKVGDGKGDWVICWICRLSSASSSFVVRISSWRSNAAGRAGDVGPVRRLAGDEKRRHSLSRCHISRSSDLTLFTPLGSVISSAIITDCFISPASRRLSSLRFARLVSISATMVSLSATCSFSSASLCTSAVV